MRYLVIATRWNNEKQAQTREVVGEFPTYYLASMFRDAYNQKFTADARVVDIEDYINA